MMDILQFLLDEVKRQRKSYRAVAVLAGLDKDILYRWREKRTASIGSVERVLDVLGYDLVAMPKGRTDADE